MKCSAMANDWKSVVKHVVNLSVPIVLFVSTRDTIMT